MYVNNEFDRGQGAAAYSVGNANLEPERTLQFEVGLQQGLTESMGLDLTVFSKDIRELAGQTAVRGNIGVPVGRLQNIDYGTVKGFTLSLFERGKGQVSWTVDYTLQFASGSASNPAERFNRFVNNADEIIAINRLDWDKRNVLNNSITWNSKFGLTLSAINSLQAGSPYTSERENVTSEALEFLRDADSQEELDEYKGFESLQKAISDITQGVDGEGDAEQYLLLSQEAFRIINAVARGDEGAPFKIEDVREKDITQRTEAFGTQMTTEELTNKWLTENSVDTDSDDIRPGAKVTISGIGKDIIAKNDAGGTNASFFDQNTGYLIFKNPSLPPGHVDPRPTAKFMGFTSKSQENWDILYGKTHRPDGTPLKPYE